METDNEIWVNIINYEGLYQISDLGKVKSLPKKRNGRVSDVDLILKQTISKTGYFVVSLKKDGKRKTAKVHRLIAKAFIPNLNNYLEINHIDCNKLNNSIQNLEWCNRAQNARHASKNGLMKSFYGELSSRAKLTNEDVFKIREMHKPKTFGYGRIAKIFNVHKETVRAIIQRRRWPHI